MTERVFCRNSYDKLRSIVLGKVDFRLLELVDSSERAVLETVFSETEQDLNDISIELTSRGVAVYRPTIAANSSRPVELPTTTIPGLKMPLSPRDNFIVLGETLLETSSWQPERYFDYLCYQALFNRRFDWKKWVCMPRAVVQSYPDMLGNQSFVTSEMYFDAANIVKYNDVLFVSTQDTCDLSGLAWFTKMFSDQYQIIQVDDMSGHLDSHFNILRPGVIISHHPRWRLPEFFKDWEIIQVNPEYDEAHRVSQVMHSDLFQDDDIDNTVLTVNVLSIDQHTVMMYDHHKQNRYLLDQFDRLGFEVVFVPFRHCYFFNQGLTCVILETGRWDDK